MGKCQSAMINEASRLAACLIMLGEGRRIEAMRTHRLSIKEVRVQQLAQSYRCHQQPPWT
jgi:hypothetical protein